MAKKRRATTQEPISYPEITEAMTLETASILSDYIRQYVGQLSNVPAPGSGIFLNFDRVLRTQTYQELAWYDLYDEVERDPHVAAVLRTLKLAASSLDWHMQPADDSARSKAIALFVEDVLNGMENFTQDLYELLDAEGKGFAVSEVIWDVGYETRIKTLMNRPQRRFQFDAMTREPKLRTMEQPYYGIPLPERKFIIHRVSAKYENPFGDALDQSLYWMWLFKRTVIKYWMTHLDIASAPVPFVQHPANANKALKDEALAIAAQMRRAGYGRLPDNFQVIWAEAKTSAQTAQSYETFIDSCNSEMTKCVLGQLLTTEGSAKGGAGSKALGEVHSDVLALRAKFSAKALESTLNRTLIKWIVDANYGSVEEYPTFVFKTDDPIDRQGEATIIKTLKDAGYSTTREYIEETIQIELEDKEPTPPPTVIQQPLGKTTVDEKGQLQDQTQEKAQMNAASTAIMFRDIAAQLETFDKEDKRKQKEFAEQSEKREERHAKDIRDVLDAMIEMAGRETVVNVAPPVVNVAAPQVEVKPPTVEFRQSAPVIHVHVPEQKPPDIHVNVPAPKAVELSVERDGQGYIKSVKGK